MSQNIFLPLITPIIKLFIENKITIFPNPIYIRGSMLLVKSLIEQGKFKAVIDREYPLEQIVEAYKYVEEGQKIGLVIFIHFCARFGHSKTTTHNSYVKLVINFGHYFK